MQEFNQEFDVKMQKTIDVVAGDFAAVRAGRANAAVLDKIVVDYYGTPTPINQVGTISSPDPRSLMIQPWDKSLLKAIEKGMVNLVITKDLSRLSRNYLESGRLIEEYFPRHGVRYIAMNDNVDTLRENNEIAPFKGILKNKRCLGGGTTKGGFMNFQMDKLQVLLHTAFTRPDRQSGKTL